MNAPAAVQAAPTVDCILDMVDRGFHVFPILPWPQGKSPGKTSRVKFKEWATRDPEKIAAHWSASPQDNIGVYTGRYGDSGALIVVDVDRKSGKDGNVTLQRLELEGFDLPDTFTVATPSGGQHLYYRAPEPVRQGANVLGPGVDIRSRGGYVVGPGSVIDGKPYAVTRDIPIAEAPPWLVERCGKAAERTAAPGEVARVVGTQEPIPVDSHAVLERARDYLGKVNPATEGDGGDDATLRVAQAVGDFGVSEAKCLDIMSEFYNPRCAPPWDADDLAQKVRNAYAYRNEPIGRLHPAAEFDTVATPPATQTRRERFRQFTVDELESLPAPDWLVRDIIPENALAEVYGPPKAGKTFWILDVALSVASGRDFHGHFVKQGPVLYIAGEGNPAQIGKRVKAWQEAHGVSKDDLADWRLISERVDISDTRTVELLLAALEKPRYAMVVIDTVNRCMSGDENSQQDMSRFVAGCDRLREALGGATVVPIHHTGKDETKGSRGSTVLRGAIDTGIRITPEGALAKVVVEDQKDAEAAPPELFERKGAGNGSAYLARVSATEAQRRVPLTGHTKTAADILHRLLADEGGPPPFGKGMEINAVQSARWREEFYANAGDIGGSGKDAAKKAFDRATKKLRDIAFIDIREGYAWVI